jgi:predicted regulator of Ras-like GTPase activity (Roadblock/LC7/MglB family)
MNTSKLKTTQLIKDNDSLTAEIAAVNDAIQVISNTGVDAYRNTVVTTKSDYAIHLDMDADVMSVALEVYLNKLKNKLYDVEEKLNTIESSL